MSLENKAGVDHLGGGGSLRSLLIQETDVTIIPVLNLQGYNRLMQYRMHKPFGVIRNSVEVYSMFGFK